jgi:hypothetical protein
MLVQIALFVDDLRFTDCESIGLSKGWECRFNAKTKAFLLPTRTPNVLLDHYAVASGGRVSTRFTEMVRRNEPQTEQGSKRRASVICAEQLEQVNIARRRAPSVAPLHRRAAGPPDRRYIRDPKRYLHKGWFLATHKCIK